MAKRPMSWAMAALIFGAMATCTFGLDMAFSSSLRHQVLSFHSDFWQVGVPGDLLGDAIIAIAIRVAFNWHLLSRSRKSLETHQG